MSHMWLCGPMAIATAMAGLNAIAHGQQYPPGEDAQRHPGGPHGSVEHGTWVSKIFPGTVRDYWIYVPAQTGSPCIPSSSSLPLWHRTPPATYTQRTVAQG
jgi:hypothetical protein